MAFTRSTDSHQIGSHATSGLEQRTLLGSIGLIAIVAMLLASMWFRPTVVIGASCALFVVGFGLAAFAWLRSISRDSAYPTHWDIAGLCVFAGIAGLIGANIALF